MERAYRESARVMATLICGVGLAMVVTTIAQGGGPLALGVVVGIAFTCLGAGRLYLAKRQ